jgi:hypothetical protein
MKTRYVFFIFILLLSGSTFYLLTIKHPSKNQDPNIVRVAYSKAEQLTIQTDKSEFLYDVNNLKWKENLELFSKNNYDVNETKSKLDNRNYQAVCFYPKSKFGSITLGGILWIFIDTKNYEVITFLLQK